MRGAADSPAGTVALPAKLAFVIAASIIPAALAGILLIGYDYYDRERSRLERDATATTRALVAAVDAELTGARAALLVLATSPHLASGDLAAFHAQARAVMKHQAFFNIILADKSGLQLVNTLRPLGAPLPAQGDPGGLLRVFKTGQPVISDLFVGRVSQEPVIGIGVPVDLGGKVRYALNGGISPGRLSLLISERRLSPGWLAGIFDRTGTIVARSHEALLFVGKPGAPDLVRKMKELPEAAFESRTLEGIATLTVFSRSPVSGWTVAIGIPQRELTAHLLTSLARLFLVAFIVLAAALGGAIFIGRRVMAAGP